MSAIAPEIDHFAFSDDNKAEVERILAKFPPERKQSAVIALLHLAQAQHGGWLPRAILDAVADMLAMPKIRVYEVASFYDMFNTEPTGRCQIRVCTTTPCWLRGSDDVVRACVEGLGVGVGETTGDGRFYLREFECLGACCNAPVLWIDDDYYEDLDYEGTLRIVEALKRGERPATGSAIGRLGSMPEGGKTTLNDVPERPQRPREGEAERQHDQAPVEKAKPDDPDRQSESSAMKAKDVVPDVDDKGGAPPKRGDEGSGEVEERDEG